MNAFPTSSDSSMVNSTVYTIVLTLNISVVPTLSVSVAIATGASTIITTGTSAGTSRFSSYYHSYPNYTRKQSLGEAHV